MLKEREHKKCGETKMDEIFCFRAARAHTYTNTLPAPAIARRRAGSVARVREGGRPLTHYEFVGGRNPPDRPGHFSMPFCASVISVPQLCLSACRHGSSRPLQTHAKESLSLVVADPQGFFCLHVFLLLDMTVQIRAHAGTACCTD